MSVRLHPLALALALVTLPGAAAAEDDVSMLPAPALKPAGELAPPPLRPPPGAPTAAAPKTPSPGPAGITARPPFDRDSGAIFFRADKLEGVTEKQVTAAGKVELRTRRETVLADWLRRLRGEAV